MLWPSNAYAPYGLHHHDLFVASDAHGAPLGVGVGVFPLLATTPTHPSFHQNQSNMLTNVDSGGARIGSGAESTATCQFPHQDCGNQAKKDCGHRRCRTCCKSRGFDCSTHVKSTWVPAARRRERVAGAGSSAGCSSGSTSGAKKPRLVASHTTATSHTSTSNTPPRSFDSGSTHQNTGFKETLPGQVRAPAVFKCVRVTAVDDGEDEFAYQAVVKIGGHVFKGFLYDQGVENQEQEQRVVATASDHQNVAGSLFPNMSGLHLGNSRVGNESSTNILDPYAASGDAPPGLLAPGSTFGN